MRLRPASLAARLGLSLGVVLIAAFGLAGALAGWLGHRALERQVRAELQGDARNTVERIQRLLSERAHDLTFWSSLETFDDILTQDQDLRIENLLLRLRANDSTVYQELTVVSSDGRVVASTNFKRMGTVVPLDRTGVGLEGGALLKLDPPIAPRHSPTVRLLHPIVSRLSPDPIGWLLAQVDWRAID